MFEAMDNKLWLFSRLVDGKGFQDSRIQGVECFELPLDPLDPYYPARQLNRHPKGVVSFNSMHFRHFKL